MITGKLGGNTDASEGLGAGNDTLNAVSSFIPGVGFFTGRTQKYTMSDQLKESTGYTGVQNDATKAQKNAGAKLLFGSGKANRLISEARMSDRAVSGVLDASKQAEIVANQIAEATSQLALGSDEQAKSVENTFGLVNRIVQSIDEIAANTSRSFESSSKESGFKI